MLSFNVKRNALLLLLILICVLRVAIKIKFKAIKDINKYNKTTKKFCCLLENN